MTHLLAIFNTLIKVSNEKNRFTRSKVIVFSKPKILILVFLLQFLSEVSVNHKILHEFEQIHKNLKLCTQLS